MHDGRQTHFESGDKTLENKLHHFLVWVDGYEVYSDGQWRNNIASNG